jgi:hypothetical protein
VGSQYFAEKGMKPEINDIQQMKQNYNIVQDAIEEKKGENAFQKRHQSVFTKLESKDKPSLLREAKTSKKKLKRMGKSRGKVEEFEFLASSESQLKNLRFASPSLSRNNISDLDYGNESESKQHQSVIGMNKPFLPAMFGIKEYPSRKINLANGIGASYLGDYAHMFNASPGSDVKLPNEENNIINKNA